MDELHVCTAFDENFSIPANTMIRSILRNTKRDVHFHLLVPSRQFHIGENFRSHSKTFEQGKFSVYSVDDNTFESSITMDGIYHFSNAALYRLFMTKHLPVEIDRVLYLDGDLVVNLDISEVFIQHSNSVFSAWIENEKKGYFNSGVFLTSLNYWRNNETEKKCVDYLIQNPNSQYKDQDALNHVFSDINDSMNKRFNFPFHDYGVFKSRNLKNSIFHFTGTVKPWKNHAPSVFPVTLWRRTHIDAFGQPVDLQKVRLYRIKRVINTIRCFI